MFETRSSQPAVQPCPRGVRRSTVLSVAQAALSRPIQWQPASKNCTIARLFNADTSGNTYVNNDGEEIRAPGGAPLETPVPVYLPCSRRVIGPARGR